MAGKIVHVNFRRDETPVIVRNATLISCVRLSQVEYESKNKSWWPFSKKEQAEDLLEGGKLKRGIER